MQCDSCRWAKTPPDLDGAHTGEVVVCSLADQFRAAHLERKCSSFERVSYHTGPVIEKGGAA